MNGTWLVEHGDAFQRLRIGAASAVVTSLPTATEMGLDPSDWWFEFVPSAARNVFAFAAGLPVVFVQTDRLSDGRQYSWPAALMEYGGLALWNKIATTAWDLRRPGFRHVIAFGTRPGKRFGDVWEDGPRTWGNGTGVNTAEIVADWMAEVYDGSHVLNPFCGRGTFIPPLVRRGFDVTGVELDLPTCGEARNYVEHELDKRGRRAYRADV